MHTHWTWVVEKSTPIESLLLLFLWSLIPHFATPIASHWNKRENQCSFTVNIFCNNPFVLYKYFVLHFRVVNGFLSRSFQLFYFKVTDCVPSPCKNGATCTETEEGYSCQPCPPGWQGMDCDQGLISRRSDCIFFNMCKCNFYY